MRRSYIEANVDALADELGRVVSPRTIFALNNLRYAGPYFSREAIVEQVM